MARYIFVTGGVVSSLGKGLSSASLAYLLQSRGYKVRIRKLDPYLNVDPGTMSPFQHGEVYVTDDGAETDLDLGHYERFSGISAKKTDNITTGKIYSDVLKRERQGKPDKRVSNTENLLLNFPTTFDTICITCEYFSTLNFSVTFTVFILATFPTSFLPRSNNIKCSANSFLSLSRSFS